MGNTPTVHYISSMDEDHPHIHGEYGLLQDQTSAANRITPTYMGNTHYKSTIHSKIIDHPHIHGEYSWICCVMSSSEGSPPHTWGIPVPSLWFGKNKRITPTYMGNTVTTACVKVPSQDHPHIHGEYSSRTCNSSTILGSPPHTWGIRGPN